MPCPVADCMDPKPRLGMVTSPVSVVKENEDKAKSIAFASPLLDTNRMAPSCTIPPGESVPVSPGISLMDPGIGLAASPESCWIPEAPSMKSTKS